jgi:hypothetical protein
MRGSWIGFVMMAVIGCGQGDVPQGPPPGQVATSQNGAPSAEQGQLPPGVQYGCVTGDTCGVSNDTCCFGQGYDCTTCYSIWCTNTVPPHEGTQCDHIDCWDYSCTSGCSGTTSYYHYSTDDCGF